MIEQTIVSGVNRQRGSLKFSEYHRTGTYYHHWGSEQHQSTNYTGHASGKIILDKYEEYGNGVWHYKPCLSVYSKYTTYPVPSNGHPCDERGVRSGSGASGKYWPMFYYMDEQYVPSLNIEINPIPAHVKSHLQSKLASRLPSLRPDVDTFVFLAELRDFSELFKSLSYLTKQWLDVSTETLFRMNAKYELTKLLPKGYTAKELVKYAAENNLAWQFAIRPFVNDVGNVLSNLVRWRNRIAEVQKGIGKVHDLGASVSFVGVDDSSSYTEMWPTCPTSSCHSISETKRWNGKLSAKLKYRYAMPSSVCKALDDVAMTLTALGVVPTIESVWELVPFSFVLDWVFNTNNIFRKYGLIKRDPNDVQVEIVDFCLAYREDEVIQGWTNWCHAPTICLERQETTRFVRWIGEEALDVLSWWIRPPSFMAVLLGASLGAVFHRG